MSSETDSVEVHPDRYLSASGYSKASYDAPRFPVYLGPLTFYVPNPGMLKYHDLHHVVSGYPTGLAGEAQVSAYELRAGCYSGYILVFCVAAILGGLLRSPRKVLRAWQSAKGTSSLYSDPIPYEKLVEMPVADLRRRLCIPPSGFER